MLQLGIILGGDLFHLGEQRLDDHQVRFKIVLPGRQVHVSQADLTLPPILIVIGLRQLFVIGFGMSA